MRLEGDDLQTQWVADPLNFVPNELRAFEFRAHAYAHAAHGELHEKYVMMHEMACVSQGQC